MNNSTISDVFDRLCARQEVRIAVRERDEEIIFQDLLSRSQAMSRALEAVIHEPGQRVGIMLPNSAAFVAAFFAVARVGGVVAPLNTQYRLQELSYYLGDLNPAAVIAGSKFIKSLLEVMPTLEMQPVLFEVSKSNHVRLIHSGKGRGMALSSFSSPPLIQQYTSGSTGVPKRVIRTHAALIAELEALRKTFDLSQADRFLGVAPFSHVNGLVRTMLASMYVGATLYPLEEFVRRDILDLLTRERITFFGGVPQMFAILGQTPLRGYVDLSALRIAFSASAPLAVADNRRFHSRYGLFLRQLYGSTETGTISYNTHSAVETCLDSVGTPIDGVRVEVLDEAGHRLPSGQEGELAVVSPFATSGYFDNPPASKESFKNGFYYSGDLGTKDETGHLRITGRKKLIINRGGFKVNPYEVEEVIRDYPKVKEVAVFGSAGPHGDDMVCCVVVASETTTSDEIIHHCRDRIAEFKIPSRIEFRDSLPKSPTGKVLRAQLMTRAVNAGSQ